MAILNGLFSDHESQRYAAECKRLASARNSKVAPKPRTARKVSALRTAWFSRIWSPLGTTPTKVAHS